MMVGMFPQDVLMSEYTAKPAAIAQNDTEFNDAGAWAHNYGSNDQVGIT